MKDLDKFYTKSSVVIKCYNILFSIFGNNLKNYFFIEPSAGAGDFLKPLIENNYSFLAFDILPHGEDIYKEDFLKLDINKYINKLDKAKTIVIGNPPFGLRAKLALEFFFKSSLFADTIAMIFPLQFQKWSIQSKIPTDFKLISDNILDIDSFYEPSGKIYKVRTTFQVWTRLNLPYKDLRIREKPITSIADFDLFLYNNTKNALKFFDKSKYEWEFAVPRQGFYDYNLKIYDETQLNPKIQRMFIKPNNDISRKILYNIDYNKLAKKNTIIPGFGKADLIQEYLSVKNRLCQKKNYENSLKNYKIIKIV